jgi:hypothetical protein
MTMTYSIPDDGKVAEAVFSVMYRHPQVRSQREMTELVLYELNKNGGDYRISGARIRRIALEKGLLELSISYNSAEGNPPSECPVCGENLKSIMNKTLDGGEIEVYRKCTKCPYTVGTANRVPGRYTFGRKKK